MPNADSPGARPPMDEVADGLPTKSAKIRALDAAGYTRSEIAEYLGIRYQHVRNVLVQPVPRGVRETPQEQLQEGLRVKVKVGPSGRIGIPAAYRQALEIEEGDEVILELADGDLRIISPATAIRRAQALVARYVPAGASLVNELIAERRGEAAREDAGE